MSGYRPLDCDLHDYLEIACLKRYRLNMVLTDGAEYLAKALTTKTGANKEEFLVVETSSEESGAKRCEIRLDRIRRIAPVDSHADFGVVDFTTHEVSGFLKS